MIKDLKDIAVFGGLNGYNSFILAFFCTEYKHQVVCMIVQSLCDLHNVFQTLILTVFGQQNESQLCRTKFMDWLALRIPG